MIVIETSAIIAILKGEAEANDYRSVIARDPEPVISAVSLYEAMVVWGGIKGSSASADVIDFATDVDATIISFETQDCEDAFKAYSKYGKGLHSKARLNLCDCVAFALADKMNAPLLFKGEDFAHTTVTPAIALKG